MIALKAPEDLLTDEAFWNELQGEFAMSMGPVCRRIIAEGARAAQAAGAIVDFDAIHREALFITRTTESVYWRMMAQTTRDALREALITWQTTGLGKRGLPDLIDALQPMFDRTRAKRIAVTETTRLFAEGNKLAADMDENVGGLQWQTAQDELVCPICGPKHNLIYPKGGVPEQPAHVGCRCRLIPASWRYIEEHTNLWQGGVAPEVKRPIQELIATDSKIQRALARRMDQVYGEWENMTGVGPCGNMSAVLRDMGVGEIEYCTYMPKSAVNEFEGFVHYYIRTPQGKRIDITNPFRGGRYMDIETLSHNESPELADKNWMEWLRENVIEKVLSEL